MGNSESNGNPEEVKELKKEIDSLDKRLIAQEHRVFHIINNLFQHSVVKPDKERFKQAGVSLISYILKRQTAVIIVAASASIISLAALLVSIQSRDLLKEQNEKIEKQNQRIIQQNQLLEADRRSSLVHLFNNIMDATDEELSHPKDTSLRIRDEDGHHSKLSKHLMGRIIALTRRLEPYRAYDYDTDSLGLMVSPERGQLLVNILESKLDTISIKEIYSRGNFSYAQLTNYQKPDVYLSGINLEFANLEKIDFKSADLKNANLNNANLKGAVLDHANLQRVELKEANLDSVALVYADLEGAILERASLRGAVITASNLYETSLRGAQLQGAALKNIVFGGPLLRGYNLSGADLSFAYLNGATLTGLHLEGINLEGADLSFTDLRGAYLKGAYLTNAVLFGCDLSGAELDNAIVHDLYKGVSKNYAFLTHETFIEYLKREAVQGWQEINEKYQLQRVEAEFLVPGRPKKAYAYILKLRPK